VHQPVGAVLTRPSLGVDRAAEILRSGWAVAGELTPLPSERDRNWRVAVDGVDAYVLKVANASDESGLLEFQHEALERIVRAGVPCPQPVRTLDGGRILEVDEGGAAPLLVRLLRWVPGRPLATIPVADRSPALLRSLGRIMGRAATALASWDDPVAHRTFQWNALGGLDVIAAHASAVTDPERASILAGWRRRLEPTGDALAMLRQGVIHNDANDHNVLVADDASRVTGLLDLGDAVWSVVVNELAVAAAYAALDARDPIGVIRTIRAGFESELELTPGERALIVELVALRLAVSVALSAHQSRLDPSDAYLTISEAPAWALLGRLGEIEPAAAAAAVGGADAR
jgi:Ser/Thr protein kinase RdoA (MazF antagonist)